ncbi:MAG: hypothetical protein O7H41_21375 [Planctomycetota bacterium]|nr:hypothetical protein [Planctomycetota bacterium]
MIAPRARAPVSPAPMTAAILGTGGPGGGGKVSAMLVDDTSAAGEFPQDHL